MKQSVLLQILVYTQLMIGLLLAWESFPKKYNIKYGITFCRILED